MLDLMKIIVWKLKIFYEGLAGNITIVTYGFEHSLLTEVYGFESQTPRKELPYYFACNILEIDYGAYLF